MIKIMCPECNRQFSGTEYNRSKFCPDCGKYLQQVKVLNPEPPHPPPTGPIPVSPDDAYLFKLWPVYMKSPIKVSAGYKFPSAEEWVKMRKQVYSLYRSKFSPANLQNLEKTKQSFYSWLLFKNNLSWTTLQRTASTALDHPLSLANLLLKLQDEDIDVASRVRFALQGPGRISGIGQGIVTALLHTFNNEQYGVWNSRTADTIRKLHEPIFPSDDLGETYLRVNGTLHKIAKQVDSDLTAVDGFMWFVSKNYEFL